MEPREVIESEGALRSLIGPPLPRALAKVRARLDAQLAALIAKSPFVLVASSDAAGGMDISPKGDAPGFVAVLDEATLAIPDRAGNRRADTFTNVLQNPRVALLFLVPGHPETLRVSGRASIVRDLALRERLASAEKIPELALVVAIEEVFLHCGKCIARSQLWSPAAWPEAAGLPTIASFNRARGTTAADPSACPL